MHGRQFPSMANERAIVSVVCSFESNGASQPLAASFEGPIESALRTGTGLWDVVLSPEYRFVGGYRFAEASVHSTTAHLAKVTATDEATRTISVGMVLAGAFADGTAGDRIEIEIEARNTRERLL